MRGTRDAGGVAVPNELLARAEAPFPRAKRDSRPSSALMHVREGMQVFADWRESDRAWLLNAWSGHAPCVAAFVGDR